jgi:hypothetical protein
MNRTKDELLLECIKQFEHIEDVLGFNRLSTTKSLIRDIEQSLSIHDVLGRSEQLFCPHCEGNDIQENFYTATYGCNSCGDSWAK